MLLKEIYTTGQEKLVNSVTEYIGNIRNMLETHPMGETQIYLRKIQKKCSRVSVECILIFSAPHNVAYRVSNGDQSSNQNGAEELQKHILLLVLEENIG